jgi:hypothetical protein
MTMPTTGVPAAGSPTAAAARADGRYPGRQGRLSYGTAIGVLMLDCNIPFVPGDVGNASTYDFPVQYHLVPGATGDAVIVRQDPALIPAFIDAAQHLVAQGVRAITGDCAYMGAFQQAVAESVEVPVFLSSLMQVQLVQAMLRRDDKLAVLVANGATVSDRLLDPVGITGDVRDRCVFRGLEDKPHFNEAILQESGELDVALLEAEMVATAQELLAEDPSIGAFLLECSDMPPYSAAVQRATGLPVFDWIGFINYVQHAVVRTPYTGFF